VRQAWLAAGMDQRNPLALPALKVLYRWGWGDRVLACRPAFTASGLTALGGASLARFS